MPQFVYYLLLTYIVSECIGCLEELKVAKAQGRNLQPPRQAGMCIYESDTRQCDQCYRRDPKEMQGRKASHQSLESWFISVVMSMDAGVTLLGFKG